MTVGEMFANHYQQSTGMLLAVIDSFSDDEIFVRPVPGANHAAWQIGHLIKTQYKMFNRMGGKLPELPADFDTKFTKETAKSDNPADFTDRKTLRELAAKMSEAVIAIVKTVKDEDLAKETGVSFVPTIFDVLALYSAHNAMHIGQMQVIRRKLGKPIMF